MNTQDDMFHVENIKNSLLDIVTQLRQDIVKVNDAKCKALFETSAEVILGLVKAFDDYAKKEEAAWK